ncbi:unnamed protein product [Withania somnifera]
MADLERPKLEIGVNGLTNRLRNSLTCVEDENGEEFNKPDFREIDLGSPVSTLRTRPIGLTTTTSSGSSSSGSVSGRDGSNLGPKKSGSGHSGELSGSVESSPKTTARGFKPGHARSRSSGGNVVNSPPINVLPTGNICPSGKILKTGMTSKSSSSKTDVLRSGTGYYGHGSIIRGGAAGKYGGSGVAGGQKMTGTTSVGGSGAAAPLTVKRGVVSTNDPEELKRLGNESYKKGHFVEALTLYDKAIAIAPGNAAYHCNRAAALIGLKRSLEAVRECEEAIRLDPSYVRAHHRFGQVEKARSHICFQGHQPDQVELQKLQAVEKHIGKCTDARRVGDWTSTLREANAAIASGADASPQLFACRAEALLKLHWVEDAESSLSITLKHVPSAESSQSKKFGMISEAYVFFVQAQIDLALGRFENAVSAVERAAHIDPRNIEVSVFLNNARLVGRARTRGNDLFNSERYTEACAAYGEGLRHDSSNSVLYCNRAACWYKLGQWEKSVDDCNRALRFQPNYTKALLRRAASNTMLERWAEAVRDYEVLRKELPYDNEVAESLFHAQVVLKKSRGEDVHNMKFGGEVELVSDLEQFRAAISSPCASVVHFKTASNPQCKQISSFLDSLTTKYPSINFLKVDVEESPAIANAENVRIVPTFKIYKKGSRVKEMICPSQEVLESSVMHYSI